VGDRCGFREVKDEAEVSALEACRCGVSAYADTKSARPADPVLLKAALMFSMRGAEFLMRRYCCRRSRQQ